MDDLLGEFIAETREMLEALGGAIVAWEAAPDDRARLDEIFRFVHTVKGNCGFFDLPRLGALSHAAEGALAEVRSGHRIADTRLVSAVLGILDRIAELILALQTGEPVASADDEQLIAALHPLPEGGKAAADNAGKAAVDPRQPLRSIRLSVDLLDRMMAGISDMVLVRNELSRCLREVEGDPGIEAAFQRLTACVAEMRDTVMRTRMQRMDSLFVPLPRLVRDISGELGKSVVLAVDGGEVELDRELIEMIRDPLTHIVRNAIDHGIETPSERQQKGKPAGGLLRVAARQSGNQILIEIADDGRGIDGDEVARQAMAMGILDAAQAERLSPAEKVNLIFEPGISTASEVTVISGRGVGMDVVRANIERIGGAVEIESKVGQGVRLSLRLPMTLSIIPALTVSVAGARYAIPRSAIEEIILERSEAVRCRTIGGTQVMIVRDRPMPAVSLAEVLGVPHPNGPEGSTLVILKPAGSDAYALQVDLVYDHEEIVVKPAAPPIMASGLYAGTSLADDGRPILLLDPAGLAAAAGVNLVRDRETNPMERKSVATEGCAGIPVLLFRTLEGKMRAAPLSIVQRIDDLAPEAVRFTAGRLRVAIGGTILPLLGCGNDVPGRPMRVLRLSDGARELAYGVVEVVDMATIGEGLHRVDAGEIGGVTLIDGEQVELLDSLAVFSDQWDGRREVGEQLVCGLDLSDRWVDSLLRPLVEAAGHRVISLDEAGIEGADLLILPVGNALGAGCEAQPVLRIRETPDRSDEEDDSIYRYDRGGLLAALQEHAGTRALRR